MTHISDEHLVGTRFEEVRQDLNAQTFDYVGAFVRHFVGFQE